MVMVSLKSMSNPRPSALESGSSVAERPRQVLRGANGRAGSDAQNRAGELLLVTGKQEQPILRPVAGANVFESVIGVDQRTRILETEAAPWRMICALEMSSPFGGFVGTAWFAGPRTLVTAGHCVFDSQQMGGWATEIRISPGRNGSRFPFGTVSSRRFSSLDRWIELRDPDFDIGAIHLDQPLGEQTGHFAVGALPVTELEGFLVNISGYPADRGFGTEQWFHSNRILKVSARRLFHDVDTFGGESGGPAWIYESEGADPTVVGIHAYGVGGTPANLGITANSAPRILPEVLEQIQTWIEADNAGS
jgi:glutamyl endopeptidase